MNEERAKRKLSAILSADVKGYSRLMGEEELATIETLKKYQELISTLVKQFKGRVVDSPGDNLLAEFGSVVDAVECAVKIQENLKEENDELSENRRMEFRIGVNLGDVVEDGERIYGEGVNIAACLESLSEPGGICISGFVYHQVKNRLKLEYEFLGDQSVKNIKESVPVYRILSYPGTAARRVIKAKKTAEREIMGPSFQDKPSIAVLPFVNMSNDPEQEYFSDGITEDIITDLSKVRNMLVIARNSTFTYKDSKTVKVQKVAEELGVRYVLEGSVRKAGDKVRITTQLIDAITGHHLWAERYDRKLEDIFAIQDEITEEVVTALDVKLVRGEQTRLWRKSLRNPEARDLYYRGRDIFGRFTKESLTEALPLFERVIDLEPDSPLGYAGAALIHWQTLGGDGAKPLPAPSSVLPHRLKKQYL